MNDVVIERDGKGRKRRRKLTDAEQSVRDAPPTQAETDTELDRIADSLLTNNRATKALARFVFDMWGIMNGLDPTNYPPMTPTQFRQQIKNRM